MFFYIYIMSQYKLFLYFNLCLSVTLDSITCSFISGNYLSLSTLCMHIFVFLSHIMVSYAIFHREVILFLLVCQSVCYRHMTLKIGVRDRSKHIAELDQLMESYNLQRQNIHTKTTENLHKIASTQKRTKQTWTVK